MTAHMAPHMARRLCHSTGARHRKERTAHTKHRAGRTTGARGRGATMGPGPEHIRRWESGALAHAVTDPFGQGPVPWLRGSETYFDDNGPVVPWYVETEPAHTPKEGAPRIPSPRTSPGGGPRSADDARRQIKGFPSPGAVAPGGAVDFHTPADPPQEFGVDIYRIGHYGGDGAAKITTSP